MAMVQLWTLLWISGYCHLLSAEVLVQYKYFLSEERQGVSLQAPAETSGTEFIWEWTSHDGSYANARIVTIPSDGKVKLNLSITRQGKYDIYLHPKLQNAGVFTFIQTKPEKVKVAQFEVFAVKVEPSRRSKVKEGSDVTMSCEVSHLPDSATLDWERDRGPTANTTLIYNNTAHIIIHSEGTYSCTLRWNGALIFSIPRTLQAESGTYDTYHTLYRGSLSSSEVVLICHSPASYRTAYWRWELSMTNVIFVASADKYKNALISMEIDKERFSSERYDGFNFPLRISPVKFGDSGRYFCFCDAHRKPMATVTLVTVQVSSVPPGGLSRNQSVVLNCQISQVIGSVTLAWLQMKRGRGKLVKQEVLSQEHTKKMLSLTLPNLSRDQLHWACAVFTESMLRAQVPLHLTLPAPEPQVLVQYKYFLSGEGQGVSLQAPAETNGTEFIWEWTSHDGSYTNARIITIQSNGTFSWNLWKVSITRQGKYDIYLHPKLQNAGVFTFIQTKPEKVNLSQFEVFAAEVKPSRWSSVKEGSDVTMSCEVSHLPDSATLDWERDTKPTANTTLIYNNTAHIIIHCADRSNEGTYNCTLRWNGALIFSIPRTLQVYKDNGRMLVISLACTAAVCVGVLLLLFLLFRRLKTAAGPSTSPAEGNGAADAVYSDVTDLQQGQVDGNGDSSAAAAVYSNVTELQKDQGNQDSHKEENESEELQYLIFSLSTPSLDPHRQQRRQLNPQSHSEQEENDKVIYASVCKT